MASTYSPSLRIELIGTGDQSGLWGSTTNNNLGGLIEQAITGVESIPMTDADYTLSALNGSVDESRNVVLIFTSGGALTTSRNIIIPSAEKTYIVKNSTTGGQNLVVKTSGGAGYTVPNGKTAYLYCDATNCHAAVDYLDTPTFNDPAFTGTPTAPTAPFGTNTTQVATTAFVQQAGLTGEIKMWPTTVAPAGYLLCNGQAVSRTTYAALFAIVGTTFGSGDGSTTFNLPNYTNRMPIGSGGSYALASTGGSKDAIVVAHTHTLSGTTSSAGTHTHGISDPGHTHAISNFGASFPDGGGSVNYASNNYGGTFNLGSSATGISVNSAGDHTHTLSGTTASTGSSGTDANLPPYLAVSFIIKH